MFKVTNEILVLCTLRGKYSIYKLKMDAAAKQKYVDLFNTGADKMIYDEDNDEKDVIPFSSTYKLGDDETFKIENFELLQCIKDAIDSSDVLDAYVPQNNQGDAPNGYKIKAILIGQKETDGTYIIAGQKFSKAQILLRKAFNLILDRDTFTEPKDKFSISASEEVDCVFTGADLLFVNYTSANKVFDLSDYYRAATEDEVLQFKSSELFNIVDDDIFMKNVKGVTVRKKIARILDMGTLSACPMQDLQAKSIEVGVQLQIVDDKIVFPSKKAELKNLLAFLAEEMYKGIITNTPYFTNSSRAIDITAQD